jgi:hypothetical protein
MRIMPLKKGNKPNRRIAGTFDENDDKDATADDGDDEMHHRRDVGLQDSQTISDVRLYL